MQASADLDNIPSITAKLPFREVSEYNTVTESVVGILLTTRRNEARNHLLNQVVFKGIICQLSIFAHAKFGKYPDPVSTYGLITYKKVFGNFIY